MTDGASGGARANSEPAPGEGRAPSRKSRRLLLPLGVVVVLVAGGLTALAGRDDPSTTDSAAPSASPSATASPPTLTVSQLASFSGTDNQITKAFTVAPNWELRWQADNPASFIAELYDQKFASRGQIVTAPKKKSGTTFVTDKGTFQLRVTARGPWSIRVVSQRPQSTATSSPAPTSTH